MKPLVFDFYCGLGGWSEAFIAEGYRAIGFDIEAHDYGTGGYPGELVLRDIRSITGAELVQTYGVPAIIVASPPCQEFSYMAMPWSKAKEKQRKILADPQERTRLCDLFNQCFRIQREVSVAAGHYVPLIVENVRGAQPWVGRARWNFGSFYLWGDVPALMPITMPRKSKSKINSPQIWKDREGGHWNGNYGAEGTKLPGNNSPRRWDEREVQRLCDAGKPVEGFKTQGMNWSDQTLRGQDFTRIAGKQAEGVRRISEAHRSKSPAKRYGVVTEDGVKQAGIGGPRSNGKGDAWFQDGAARHGSKSNARKAASATIAKIPRPLAQWIARVYKPKELVFQ